MGLTIHYQLKHSGRDPASARKIIEQLRDWALNLPFQEVGPLVELSGDACDYKQVSKDDPNRWLLIQARKSIIRPPYHHDVFPDHLFAFNTIPGNGCEPANFGLCHFPSSIVILDRQVIPLRRQRLQTQLSGWSWGSFCKTQYASNPDCGGVENFLRCHLLVVRMLDHARELGILESASDEGGDLQKRDVPTMAREVGEGNQMIAAAMGKYKDLLGDGIEGEILKFPNFEHLEADGQRPR